MTTRRQFVQSLPAFAVAAHMTGEADAVARGCGGFVAVGVVVGAQDRAGLPPAGPIARSPRWFRI